MAAFPANLLCLISGLPEDTCLNNCPVRVVEYLEDRQRYHVTVHGTERTLFVLESSLQLLEAGERVEIHGVPEDPIINGKSGEIIEYIANYGKYTVALDVRPNVLVANPALRLLKADDRDVRDMTSFLAGKYLSGFAGTERVVDEMNDYGEFIRKPRRSDPWNTYRIDLCFDDDGSKGRLQSWKRNVSTYTLDVLVGPEHEYEANFQLDFLSYRRVALRDSDGKVVATLVINDISTEDLFLEGFVFEHPDGEEEHLCPLNLSSHRSRSEIDSDWRSELPESAILHGSTAPEVAALPEELPLPGVPPDRAVVDADFGNPDPMQADLDIEM